MDHEIKPQKENKFVGSPKGLKVTFPDGRKMIVVQDNDGGFSLVEKGDESNKEKPSS
jgi:hypothetical protein